MKPAEGEPTNEYWILQTIPRHAGKQLCVAAFVVRAE
jgi:hypothetical protein